MSKSVTLNLNFNELQDIRMALLFYLTKWYSEEESEGTLGVIEEIKDLQAKVITAHETSMG
tara:strand:+ start:221 stop:403 length:183 start_codon:yes stop_codon:yes gene_type:complete